MENTTTNADRLRLAAVGDVHCNRKTNGELQPMFAEVAARADVLVLCGDLTDYGLPEEARNLVQELAPVKVPIVAVLGNHDCESGHQDEITRILQDRGIHLLDGDVVEIQGVGFTGVKGFAGGFGRRTLEPWGEQATKAFVHEAVSEALKLESGLARLRTPQRVAVLHYAPIEATVEGEPREIFPFLGSSRLEEPLNRYRVALVVHGHAHRGSPEGRTSAGIPVYNVALPLMRRLFPEDLGMRYLGVDVPMPAGVAEDTPARRHDDR